MATNNSNMIVPQGEGSVKYAYKLTSMGCMCCCLLVVIIAAAILAGTNSKFDSWIETTGTVTDILLCSEGDNGDTDTYQRQIQYNPIDATESSSTITAETDVCSSIVNYEIGDEIDIIYNPNNLQQIQTQNFVEGVGLVTSIMVGVGCLFFCVSVCAFAMFSGMLGRQQSNSTQYPQHQQQQVAEAIAVPVYSGGGTTSTAGPIQAYK